MEQIKNKYVITIEVVVETVAPLTDFEKDAIGTQLTNSKIDLHNIKFCETTYWTAKINEQPRLITDVDLTS